MNDTKRLNLFLKLLDLFSFDGVKALGKLVKELESLFESISEREATFERAFYNFWNAAEVICVSHVESGTPISGQERRDVERLLATLQEAANHQLIASTKQEKRE
jgi:hypothetical protein